MHRQQNLHRNVRNTQRSVLACTECVRRKIRCSKTVPCDACIRANKQSTCQREQVAVVNKGTARRHMPRKLDAENADALCNDVSQSSFPGSSETIPRNPLAAANPSPTRSISSTQEFVPNTDLEGNASGRRQPSLTADASRQHTLPAQSTGPRLTEEAATALEFLAHGRRSVVNQLAGTQPSVDPGHSLPADGTHGIQWNVFFPPDSARILLTYHEEHLAWMHGIVQMQSFREEFETNTLQEDCAKSWMALYYAILAVGSSISSPSTSLGSHS